MPKITIYHRELFFIFLLSRLVLVIGVIGIGSCKNKTHENAASNRIVIEAKVSKYFYEDLRAIFDVKEELQLQYLSLEHNPFNPGSTSISGTVKEGKVSWVLYSNKPIRVAPPFGATIIMKPGDSMQISYISDQPKYSGNIQHSLNLLDSLMLLEERLLKPQKKNSYNAATLEDFLEWNQYLDQLLELQLPVIEYYKDKIIPLEYDYYKGRTIGKAEYNRVSAFVALSNSVLKNTLDISRSNLVQIWDSTQYKPSRLWLQNFPSCYGSVGDVFTFVQMETLRKYNFSYQFDSTQTKEEFTHSMYTNAKQNYQGMMRERLLTYILDESTLTEMGLKNPMTLALLKDYYNQPGYPEYKKYVKSLEEKQRIHEKELIERGKHQGKG